MTLRRIASVLAAILTLGVTACRRAELPRLPVLVPHAQLPPAFDQALREARGAVDRASVPEPEAVRRLARLYHANRLFAEAKACYRVIAAAPGGLTARDHYYLADIAQQDSDLAGAQGELQAVLAAAPEYLPAHLALADAFFKSGQEAAAEDAYAAILILEPDQPEALIGLARGALQRGDDAAAIARLERVMAVHPDAMAGAALLAKIMERRGETARAVALSQWSQQKPRLPPADPWLDALLADCYDAQRLSLTFEEYFKLGRMEEAVPLLDRLAVLDPTGPITMMFAGVSHAKALEHITAVREYYAALGKGGDPEKICPYLVQSLLAMGNVSEAATVIAGYYAKTPDSLPLAKAYADVALRQGDDRLARTLLEKVLGKEPYLQAQNMSLAKIYWTAGEREAAAVCLQRVAAAYPADLPSRALLGEYYLGKSDPAAAIKVLEPALAGAPAHSPVRDNLAGLLGSAYFQAGGGAAERGELAEAAALAERAILLNNGDLNAQALKADVAVRLKHFPQAAEALGRLAALQPANPTIYLSWGDVLYQAGKTAEAGAQWQKALSLLPPADQELRAALQERLAGRITPETFQ